jgi:hypothetical protein
MRGTSSSTSGRASGSRHQEVAADAPAQVVDAVQELGQEGMQAGGQDLVDAAVLQVGAQAAGAAQGLAALSLATRSQVATTSFMLACQRARHVGAQDQQLGHRSGLITLR